MFTGLEEQYLLSSDLADRGMKLLRHHLDLTNLLNEVAEGRIGLAFLWDNRPFDAAREEVRPHTLARAHKAPALWATLSGYTGAIVVRKWLWAQLDERARDAVLYHELLHFTVKEAGVITVRSHDLEEFASVVEEYGSFLEDRKRFLSKWMRWERKQDLPETTGA